MCDWDATTVEPLYKDTPELRTPLKGTLFVAPSTTLAYISTPEIRTPLYKGHFLPPRWCPHKRGSTVLLRNTMMCESRGDQLSCRWSVESCEVIVHNEGIRRLFWLEEVIDTFCHGYPDIELSLEVIFSSLYVILQLCQQSWLVSLSTHALSIIPWLPGSYSLFCVPTHVSWCHPHHSSHYCCI